MNLPQNVPRALTRLNNDKLPASLSVWSPLASRRGHFMVGITKSARTASGCSHHCLLASGRNRLPGIILGRRCCGTLPIKLMTNQSPSNGPLRGGQHGVCYAGSFVACATHGTALVASNASALVQLARIDRSSPRSTDEVSSTPPEAAIVRSQCLIQRRVR